jgi:hypothetical protein
MLRRKSIFNFRGFKLKNEDGCGTQFRKNPFLYRRQGVTTVSSTTFKNYVSIAKKSISEKRYKLKHVYFWKVIILNSIINYRPASVRGPPAVNTAVLNRSSVFLMDEKCKQEP